jgi:acyl-CoA hydrolase
MSKERLTNRGRKVEDLKRILIQENNEENASSWSEWADKNIISLTYMNIQILSVAMIYIHNNKTKKLTKKDISKISKEISNKYNSFREYTMITKKESKPLQLKNEKEQRITNIEQSFVRYYILLKELEF